MDNVLDITETELKLKEMSLKNEVSNCNEKPESVENRNFLELDFTQTPSFSIFNGNSEFTFDNVIGHLEDMLIDEEFQALQNSFLEKYWEEFDRNEENKHLYMTIFNEYTNKTEDFIVTYLKKWIKNFDMDLFVLELEQRKNTLEGEIFEVLSTLSDFSAFKEIFLDYRAMKEGHTIDLCESLSVSSIPL